MYIKRIKLNRKKDSSDNYKLMIFSDGSDDNGGCIDSASNGHSSDDESNGSHDRFRDGSDDDLDDGNNNNQ